jgi:2-methylcitrate dehydratase PrpD
MNEEVTKSLGKYVAGTRYEDLSEEVIYEAKRRIADVLAIGLSGATTSTGRAMRNFSGQFSGSDCGAGLWGSRQKAPGAIAALSNGTMSYHLELDDVHRTSHTHPGLSVIPAALAMCEEKGLGPREFICSVVVGYDVITRVGMAVSPSIYVDRVFLAPGTLSALGAAGAVGNIIGLDEEEAAKLLGIAAFLSPLAIFESFARGAPIKNMAMGWGNLIAIWGAAFNQEGLFGPVTGIEGQFGYARATADTYDLSRINDPANVNTGIINTGIKPYACCRQHHSAIDAALEIKNNHGVEPENIQKVVVRTFAVASRGNNQHPATIAGATYSAPFSVASALITGECWREQYTEEQINNPQILELASKIEVVSDDELDRLYDEKWPSIVEITTRHGTYSARWDLMKGEPEHPVTDQELKKKFISLATDCVSDEHAMELWDGVYNLENSDNLEDLTRLMQWDIKSS